MAQNSRGSHVVIALLLALTLVAIGGKTSRADEFDDAFLVYAVNVHQTPMQSWGPGYGIYLGNGLFITAAHVVGRSWLTRPKVAIAGHEFPTSVVREGSFEATDLTLLAVAPELLPLRLRLRLNPLCKGDPQPGQDVITAVPEGTARSHVLSPKVLPPGARGYSTVIGDVARTGNSGSGVFDPQHHCLLGIVSRKISQVRSDNKSESRDIAKYFVPASAIAAFLPPGPRPDQ